MKTFDILDSTSELKIRVFALTMKDLFRHALIGMFKSIHPRYAKDSRTFSHPVSLLASDRELLLIDFLTEALYLSDTRNEAFLDAKIETLTDQAITAVILGRKVCGFDIEIKAVTHHGVLIRQEHGLITTDILFDI